MNYEITKPPVNYPMGLTGSLPNTGKNIAEIGFYVSTTPPPALSTIDSEIPDT